MDLILSIVYLLAIVALHYIIWQYSKTWNQAKQQVRNLQDICDIAQENNEKLVKNISVAGSLNEKVSYKIDHLNSIRNRYMVELNLMETMRQDYEAALKPIDRSRKKKIRGKRRK